MPRTTKKASTSSSARLEEGDWITLVFGMPNTGKTTWTRAALKSASHVVAWDPTGGFAKGCGSWDFQGRVRDFLAYAAGAKGRVRRARVWGNLAAFELICRYVLRSGNTVFAVDEAHVCLPPSITTKHPFCDLLVQVRHLRTPLILVSWRPHSLPAFSRSGVSRVVAFRLTDARSLEWIEREAGASAELAAKLPGLPQGTSRRKPRHYDWRP